MVMMHHIGLTEQLRRALFHCQKLDTGKETFLLGLYTGQCWQVLFCHLLHSLPSTLGEAEGAGVDNAVGLLLGSMDGTKLGALLGLQGAQRGSTGLAEKMGSL